MSAWLLKTLAARPEGEKVAVAAIARSRGVDQATVIAGIEQLIAAGKLDSATLRPVETVPRPDLFELAAAEAARRGISRQQASVEIFGNGTQLYGLKSPKWRPSSAVVAKIEAWLAKSRGQPSQPNRGARSRGEPSQPNRGSQSRGRLAAEKAAAKEQAATNSPPPASIGHPAFSAPSTPTVADEKRAAVLRAASGPAIPANQSAIASAPAKSPGELPESAPPPAPVASATLLAEIHAFCAARGVPPTRFGRIVIGDQGFVTRRLRRHATVTAATAAKVREAIASPPAALVAQRKPGRQGSRGGPTQTNRGPRAPRDLTREPFDPEMELADRQRLNGQRHGAQVRRGQEAAAAAKLDSGEAAANSFEQSLMNTIKRRREDEARHSDPIESAKLALQRRGWRPVCSMAVHGGRADLFMVGHRKNVTKQQLLAMAERA